MADEPLVDIAGSGDLTPDEEAMLNAFLQQVPEGQFTPGKWLARALPSGERMILAKVKLDGIEKTANVGVAIVRRDADCCLMAASGDMLGALLLAQVALRQPSKMARRKALHAVDRALKRVSGAEG